jgi:UDP-glucose 4-epimerase
MSPAESASTSPQPPRKALITGGAGFIGGHLAEALLGRGDYVTVIDDLSTGRFATVERLQEHPRYHFAIDTILNDQILDRLVSECDLIYHLAAAVGVELVVKDPVHVIETNVLGTQAVLKAARRYRKKVLIASTSEIYGKNEDIPSKEDSDRLLGSTTDARWSYSTSKAVDEYLGLAYHHQLEVPVVIVRLFNTIGPRQTGQYGMVVPRFVQQALAGEPLTVYGDGQQSRAFCDVRDTVKALIALMDHPDAVGQIFNVGSSREITILDLARLVLSLLSPEGGTVAEPDSEGIVLVPFEEAYARGFEDMRRRVPDVSRIRSLVGWEPQITLEETLKGVIEDCRSPA